MKILKIYPAKDHPQRYNYHINYGVWDNIDGDSVILETFNADLNEYDCVFMPMYARWAGHSNLLDRIKGHNIRKVLFDNDCYHRSFEDSFYEGMDFIFYRCLDKHSNKPARGSHLLWSVDHERMKPVYGGEGVSFACSLTGYPFRKEIAQRVNHKSVTGVDYIKHLQSSAGAIHANNGSLIITHAKVLEFAACGTQIISNRTPDMNLYFPDELITYFDTIDQLVDIVKTFEADISIQKQLREIIEDKHTDRIRAKQIINEL